MKKYWLWLLPVLFFADCKTAQKATYKPEEIVPSEKSLFWKISGNGLKKPSFLYGTIHIIPKSEYQMPSAAQRALEDMQRVAFEIDMKEMTSFRTQLSLMTKAFMAGGKTLKDLLPTEDYTFVRKKMDEKGLPAGMMERIKPMFLSMMFSGDEGGVGMAGDGKMTSVEMELYRMSKKRKLESAGLETAAYQMSIFDSIPYVDQAKMLLQSLRSTDSEKGGDELERMLKLYREQDIAAMQSAIGDEEGGMGNYEDLLLNKRNRNWIPVMSRMMRDKPTMFAVGAGHLGGVQGVVALLRKEGYRVEAAF
jgi:uncharacterized protein